MLTIEWIGWILSAVLAISFIVSLFALAKEPKNEDLAETVSKPEVPAEEERHERPRIKIH